MSSADESMRARRAAIDERMAARELERQSARAIAKQNASSDSLELPEYEASFAAAHDAALVSLSHLSPLAASDGAPLEAALQACTASIESIHKLVAAAASFLPSATLAASNAKTAELEVTLRSERQRLAPKKKFSFKNRGKVGAPVGAAAPLGVTPPLAAPARPALAHADSFAASAASCQGLRDRADATLIRAAGEDTGSDFALSHLRNCTVHLLSGCTALWIRKLEGCTILAVPVAGAVYITECTDCRFLLGSRQVRIHTSSACDFYLHAASHPIIEHCERFRFAPYAPLPLPEALAGAFEQARLDPAKNSWDQVETIWRPPPPPSPLAPSLFTPPQPSSPPSPPPRWMTSTGSRRSSRRIGKSWPRGSAIHASHRGLSRRS